MDQRAYEIAEKLVIASKRAYNRGIQTGRWWKCKCQNTRNRNNACKSKRRISGRLYVQKELLITDFEGNLIEGTGKPTREALLHGYLYKLRPDIQAVVHVHSPYAIDGLLPRRIFHL